MPFAGPASSVLQEINQPSLFTGGTGLTTYVGIYPSLYQQGYGTFQFVPSPLSVGGLSGLAYFSQSGPPFLPSNIDEVVLVTQNAYLGANVEIGGNLIVDGLLVASVTAASTGATSFAVNPGPLTVIGPSPAGGLLTVQNTAGGPGLATLLVIANTSGDRALGVEVTGDGFTRWKSDSNGLFQWGTGASLQDTNLYRLGVGTLRTDNNFSVGGAILGGMDTTAADIQSDGVQGAGAVGKPADAGHVHPYSSWLTTYIDPTVATAETVPRVLGIANSATLQTATLYLNGIGLPANLAINSLSFSVGNTNAANVTHGWYAITDANRVVRATTADQGSSTIWGTAATNVTLALSTGYTTPSAGIYYLGVCIVSANTTPNFAGIAGLAGGLASLPPIIHGTVSATASFTGPPSLGTTLNGITASGTHFYAYTS